VEREQEDGARDEELERQRPRFRDQVDRVDRERRDDEH
jgi:hypothetical protein